MITRRAVIASGVAAALAPCAAGAEASRFTIDCQGGQKTPEVARSLAGRITLVEGLKIKPDIAAFFAAQPITVDRAADTQTRAGPRGIFFERRPVPADDPVLPHDLLHRYQLLRPPGGVTNPQVRAFYDEAKASGLYPARSYMLTPFEFHAMMASVVLHGRVSRPPLRRANVALKSPGMYAWIVADFGLTI